MNAIIELVRELLVRVQLKSPKLYVKLQWISSILGTVIGALLVLNTSFDWGWGLILILHIPLTTILSGVVTFLTGIFLLAITPVEDKKALTEKLDKQLPDNSY